MTLPADVGALPVLSAGAATHTWGDVFLWARLRGEWEALVEAAAAPEAALDAEALRRAGAAFRTERRLLAADELREWLAEHRLTLDDWHAYLRRRAGPGGATAEPAPGAIWAEGVCSGALARFSEALAQRAAALAAMPDTGAGGPPPAGWFAGMPAREEAAALGMTPDEVPSRAGELWRAQTAYERLRKGVVESDAPRRVLAARGADWLRIDCEYVLAASEDVAREAALLLREDGLPIADVARAAGLELVEASMHVGDMPQELRVPTMSAAPGDRIGPVGIENGTRFAVMVVRGKVAPTMHDPEIRSRAEAAAVEQALAREVAERVTWHERY